MSDKPATPPAAGAACWMEAPADEAGDAIIAALAAGGVEYVFFTSGSEIAFYQEAIAKARALGRPAPRLITINHEHVGLNAALGYAAVSGRPAVTAVHVDCGTLHQGGAIHTAMHAQQPVLLTAGVPPTSYPGSSPGARNSGGHLWLQQKFDQHGIVRQYMKWDHQLQAHDNPGLMVSRALQVACTEPRGPVYLSIPPEVSMRTVEGARFPAAAQLGIAAAPGMDADTARDIAQRLCAAANPAVIVSGSGRDPQAVQPLVELCELLGMAVVHAPQRAYQCMPMNHPLLMASADLTQFDALLCLETDVPWLPGGNEPAAGAWIAVVAQDPAKEFIPTYEFHADLRVRAGAAGAARAIAQAARARMTDEDRRRAAARGAAVGATVAKQRETLAAQAAAAASKTPIDPLWIGACVGALAGEHAIVFDDTLPHTRLHEFLRLPKPGSYFFTPGSSGGWAPGAALGAKLAAPDRDVIAVSGDGFYMFGTPAPAIWAARHHGAPYLTVVYQNRSYVTGTVRVSKMYPGGYAQRGGFEGGYFDPPMDFAREAEAAGGWGENVTDPAQLPAALERGMAQVRQGVPAVIAVRLARLMQDS